MMLWASHMYGSTWEEGKKEGGEYFLVPRKFNEMVKSISTTYIDNDIGEYF